MRLKSIPGFSQEAAKLMGGEDWGDQSPAL